MKDRGRKGPRWAGQRGERRERAAGGVRKTVVQEWFRGTN